MSLDDLDNQVEVKKSAKNFSFEKYMQQLQQIDMSNMGSWPISVKVTMYIFILIVIGLLAYFIFISSVQDDIAAAETQQTNLLNDYRDKDSKYRNLQAYQKQVQDMEVQFNQQLTQLPKQTEIPGLVEDINRAGVESGLAIKNISLQPEIKQEVFIQQPIDITVQGNYHDMGGFVSAISLLPRIVTLHDFTLSADTSSSSNGSGQQSSSNAVPKLTMNIKANTYRYMSDADKAATDTTGAKANNQQAAGGK